jgi:hypothetical protein
MENNLTKDVEFIRQQTSRKVVFDGTYTAKKGDIDLNKFEVTGTAPKANNDITFYLFVNGEEVADADLNEKEVSFSDVRVADGKSVSIKLEAEIDAYGEADTLSDYNLKLWGDDKDGNEAGTASDSLVTIKIKDAGSVKVDAAASKNTVLLRAKNQKVAEFSVKPSNSADTDLTLDNMTITVSLTTPNTPAKCELPDDAEEGAALATKPANGWTAETCTYTYTATEEADFTDAVDNSAETTYFAANELRIKVAGTEVDDCVATGADSNSIYCEPNEEVGSEVKVSVEVKAEVSGIVKVVVDSIN